VNELIRASVVLEAVRWRNLHRPAYNLVVTFGCTHNSLDSSKKSPWNLYQNANRGYPRRRRQGARRPPRNLGLVERQFSDPRLRRSAESATKWRKDPRRKAPGRNRALHPRARRSFRAAKRPSWAGRVGSERPMNPVRPFYAETKRDVRPLRRRYRFAASACRASRGLEGLTVRQGRGRWGQREDGSSLLPRLVTAEHQLNRTPPRRQSRDVALDRRPFEQPIPVERRSRNH